MTLIVNVIQKLSGSYTATYSGGKVTRSAQTPQPVTRAPRTAKPFRTHTPRKGAKQATPAIVARVLAEIAQEPAQVITAQSVTLADYVATNPRAGIPVKGDKISFVKLETPEYNGMIITNKYLPGYILVNQRGEIMREVDSLCNQTNITGEESELQWTYSPCDTSTVTDVIKKQKRLTRWLNASIKAPQKEEITLSGAKKINDNEFRLTAEYFTKQLKGMSIKANSFFQIGGRIFPAQTIRDIFKLLKNEIITLVINPAEKNVQIVYTCDGLKGRSTIKAAKQENYKGILHLIPVIA